MRVARIASEAGIGGQVLVSIKEKSFAVVIVSAGARHDIDRAVARQAGGDIEVDGRELELLHDTLRYLKDHACDCRHVNASAIHGHPAISDAWNRLESGA